MFISKRAALRIRLVVTLLAALVAVALYYDHSAEFAVLCAVFMVIVAALAGFWFVPVPGPFVVLDKGSGKVLHYCPAGEKMRAVNDQLAPHKRIDLGMQVLHSGNKLQPITPNPKVRNMSYTVSMAFGDSVESAQRFYAAYGWLHSSEQFGDRMPPKAHHEVKYWLNEFNEVHSVEASKFYNPLEPAQQQEFEGMIRSYLDPLFAPTGMRVASARFSLN